ncbi:MAG: cyclic nucleotide-binding domain-containing protein [Halieaceae bacterium]|nr:cyclic nucleotide-binding domain-containing protein [Halieaceae bacterium]
MQLSKSFLISEMPLFDSLNVDEVQEIQKWLIFKKLEPETVIYKQGSSGRSVCFVVEGELSVIKRADDGDATIAKVGKGESVGEMAIIDGLTRSADVVAATETQVLILKRDDFDKLVSEQPEIGVKILKSLAKALSMTLRDRSETLARLMHV